MIIIVQVLLILVPLGPTAIQMMDNIVCKTMDFNVIYQLDTCAQHQIQSTY